MMCIGERRGPRAADGRQRKDTEQPDPSVRPRSRRVGFQPRILVWLRAGIAFGHDRGQSQFERLDRGLYARVPHRALGNESRHL